MRCFITIFGTVFNLQSGHEYMVEMAVQCQRTITSIVGKPELRFMCSARRIIVLYICMTFRKISWTVWWKYFWRHQLWSGHKWWKRWRTDTQNFGRYNIIPSPLFCGGQKKCTESINCNHSTKWLQGSMVINRLIFSKILASLMNGDLWNIPKCRDKKCTKCRKHKLQPFH